MCVCVCVCVCVFEDVVGPIRLECVCVCVVCV